MLDSKACQIHPNSSSLKLSVPPIITVTSTSDDSESELSRTSSIISLKSSDSINSTHLIDGDKSDGLFDGQQWTYCLVNQDLINNNSHSALLLTTTINCFPSTHQYTHVKSMHSVIGTGNSEEILACSPTSSTSTTLSSSSSSLPSSTNFNNCDLLKLCLDQISASPILKSTLSDLQSSVSDSSNDIGNLPSPSCHNDNSNCITHQHHFPYQLDENYTEIINNHCGFVCICHIYKIHQSKHSSTNSVVDIGNKKLSKSISSTTTTSSSTASSYSSDSSQLNNDKQTKTFLKRFQNFLIHSIRKSSPLIKNSNTIQVNNNDYNELLTMKDSIQTQYHPTMKYHKKRSKSLRVISNCLHSVTTSQCSLKNNTSSRHENKVCNHCLQYDKHMDKSPFFNLMNTKKQHNVNDNSNKNVNSSKYFINIPSKHRRKLLTCHDYPIVSKAVEKFISNLNQALDYLLNKSNTTNATAGTICNPSHQSYDSFKQILIELVIVLQCKQFIKDFVKCEGHCKLFQLVEIIDKVDKSFHDEIWTHLLACIVELSKHAITNRLVNDNDATIVDNNSNHRDLFYPQEDCGFTLNNDDYMMHSSDEITITKHDNEKVDDQTIKYSPTILPRSIHATEFFSWQLVSEQFLSVITEHCRKETKLDCLLNEMKLLVKITTDYPVHIPYVIKQTGQGFILDLLKIIQLNISGPKSSVSSTSVRSETLRCEIQNLIMKFLYVVFYYGKQQGRLVCLIHQFSENVQFIEWIPELRDQSLWKSMVTSYYPKKHQSDYSMTTLNPFSLFNNDASDENAENKFVLKYLEDFSNFLENDSCCKTEYNTSNNNMIIYGSSNDNVGQQQRQRNSSYRLANNSIQTTNNNDSSSKQSSIHLLSSLCRVQQIANSLLVTRMNTPLDPTSEKNIEKMNQLCSAVYFDEYTINSTVELNEEACIKLGFTIPADPYADFNKPPGILGFQCIYFYIMKNRTKLTDMLNYAYPRQKQTYLPTNYCKSNYLSEFNLSSYSNVNSNFDARGNSQRIQRHFSTVDSNHMQQHLLHTSPGVQHQQQRNNNTGRRFTVDSLTPANLSQSFNKPNRECDSSSQSFLHNYSVPSSTSSTSTISFIDKKPLFPIIEAANAVTNMLCELITTSDTIHEPYFIMEQNDKDFCLPSLFYPILLSHNNQFNNSSFEDLFDCVFSIFFYSWTQMKAVPEDLIAIVCVVREQINRILQTVPISFEEFEKSLATFNPYDVPSMWSKRENRLRVSMLHNHPALIELRNSLRKRHQGHVYENRLNILSNSAPLEYIPSKGSKLCSKDNQSFTVLLSTDRKSLVIRDINQTIREIWPLNCVIRVSLGITEKVKKNPERTLVLQLELTDASNQDDPNESMTNKSRFLRVSLLARSIIEYNYWLDGLFLLNKLNNPSDYYNEDVERLTDLDMRIRLSSLDLNQLPKKEIQIPPDPPPLDFI